MAVIGFEMVAVIKLAERAVRNTRCSVLYCRAGPLLAFVLVGH